MCPNIPEAVIAKIEEATLPTQQFRCRCDRVGPAPWFPNVDGWPVGFKAASTLTRNWAKKLFLSRRTIERKVAGGGLAVAVA